MDISKRAFDLLFGVLLLLVFLIPLVIICTVVKISEPGKPVLFLQKRYTKGRRVFTIFKVRTMTDGAVTSVGRFLRTRGLDEIPQLFNVILGDMSIVGPRAHCIKEADLLEASNSKYAERFLVKAGITGPAQILGYAPNKTELEEVGIESDIWYCHSSPLFYDIFVLAGTVRIVLSGQRY